MNMSGLRTASKVLREGVLHPSKTRLKEGVGEDCRIPFGPRDEMISCDTGRGVYRPLLVPYKKSIDAASRRGLASAAEGKRSVLSPYLSSKARFLSANCVNRVLSRIFLGAWFWMK